MNRWSRIVLGIAAAGLLAWAATGVQGRLAGASREALAWHTLAGFGATLLLLLANAWVVIFLTACERGLRRRASVEASRLAPLAGARRGVAAVTALAVGATLAQIALSSRFYPGLLPAWVHLALAATSLASQAGFWLSARRALRAQHALCVELERRA